MTLLNLTAVGAVYFWPEVLLQEGSHVVFAAIQTIAFFAYLIYVFRFFARMAPIILRVNQEEKQIVEFSPKAKFLVYTSLFRGAYFT